MGTLENTSKNWRIGRMPKPWSKEEVALIVQDYFSMLQSELLSAYYNKTEHRQKLKKILSNRSEGSIEMKHQNISAVLIELGMPYINGYKPRGNYQNLLLETIKDYISENTEIVQVMEDAVNLEAEIPSVENILESLVAPPKQIFRTQCPQKRPPFTNLSGTNYLRKEAQNQKLGLAGEIFVINFEKAWLISRGKNHLSEIVEHTALFNDAAGFDIHSYNEDGSDKFIEAKTTRFGQYTPFFATRNEVEFSTKNHEQYWLYRVFEFEKNAKMFTLKGSLTESFTLTPTEFMVRR
ncbi:MAG: DUF3883 domain-containing protein [Thermovirgaceae bacterium]